MFKVFFAIFIVVPLLELYVLIEVGSAIGALPTILLTILTAALGAFLMKYQGLQVLKQAQLSMSRGEAPQQQVLESVLIFIGGVMLLLPGLVSDFFGLILLVPPIRAYLAKRWLLNRRPVNNQDSYSIHTEWTVRDTESGRIHYHETNKTPKNSDNQVIEGEIISDDRNSDPKKG